MRRRRGIDIGANEGAITEDGDRGDRGDPAHRHADHRHAIDAAFTEPGQGTRHVLDLAQTEGRRRIFGVAVAANVEPEDAGRAAQERAVLHEVRRDRPRGAMEEQDRLVRIGPPARVGSAPSAPTHGRTTGDRRVP